MTVLMTGEVSFASHTENPWLTAGWARKTRAQISATTLASPLVEDTAFAAHGLRAAGFDAVSLASAKLIDSGGLEPTLALLSDLGVKTIGAGERAYEPAIVEQGGERVAFLAATSTPIEADIPVAYLGDSRFIEAVGNMGEHDIDSLYLMLNVPQPGLRVDGDADFSALMVDFDGIVVSGRSLPLHPIRSTSSFVAFPGVFHDATAKGIRWATAVWANRGKCEFSPVSQRRNPPLTRTGTRLPMRLLGVGDSIRDVAEPLEKSWF